MSNVYKYKHFIFIVVINLKINRTQKFYKHFEKYTNIVGVQYGNKSSN